MPKLARRVDKPFMRKAEMLRWQARFPRWIPKDASPSIPIEPFGKNLFIYNARPDVELHGDPRAPTWEDTRADWLLTEQRLSLGGPRAPAPLRQEEADDKAYQLETKLCVTDFRKRVLFYLSPHELEELAAQLGEIQVAMADVRDQLEDAAGERMSAHERDQRFAYGPFPYDRYWNVKRGKNMFNSYRYRQHGLFRGRKVLPDVQNKWASRKA